MKRRGDYYPATVSPMAWRLQEMLSIRRYWRDRTGPDFGYALDAESMQAISDGHCRDLAGAIISQGVQPCAPD